MIVSPGAAKFRSGKGIKRSGKISEKSSVAPCILIWAAAPSGYFGDAFNAGVPVIVGSNGESSVPTKA